MACYIIPTSAEYICPTVWTEAQPKNMYNPHSVCSHKEKSEHLNQDLRIGTGGEVKMAPITYNIILVIILFLHSSGVQKFGLISRYRN